MFSRMLIATSLAFMVSSGWYYTKANLLEIEVDNLHTEMMYLKQAQKIQLFEQSQEIHFKNQKRRGYEEIPSHIGTHTITL